MTHSSLPLTRRSFLKSVGATAGALTFSGWQFLPAFASNKTLRVGLLTPNSSLYPQLSHSLIAGLTLFLEQNKYQVAERPVQLLVEDVGRGYSQAWEVCQSWLAKAEVDVVVAAVGEATVSLLHPLFTKANVPLLVLTAGANDYTAAASSLSTVSAQHALANYSMGEWAARTLGHNAFLLTSFYDGGFEAVYRTEQGVLAGGGAVVGSMVTHQQHEKETNWAAVWQAVAQAQPHFLYAHYSGPAGQQFLQAYLASGLNLPLVSSSFILAQGLTYATYPAGMYSAASWSGQLNTPENLTFQKIYRAKHGQNPDVWAVMAYEAGQILAAPAGTSSLTTPRGNLVFNAAGNRWQAPLYLCQLYSSQRGWDNVVLDQLAMPTSLPALEVHTGWLTPFLCV